MDSLIRDITFGCRLLWKDRGFALTAILTLDASLYRLIFSQALGVGIPALALGLVGGYVSGILMSAAFPEFPEPFDPGLFAGVIAVLGLVQVLASLIPAHRATRVDPMAALRLE